ncbi:MAG TPA: DinB family protein [Gemmatimonadales bacterium]|nr:DinB family protein [Gemmatimonadales bacterium]
MNDKVRLLLDVFEQAYTAPAWHGTPLKGTLRGLTAREAIWRPGPRRHCIWDLVLHTAYWKCMVRRRLLRDPEIAFPRDGANWPALPVRLDNAAWKRDRALLDEQHALLRRAIAGLDPRSLNRRGWHSQWPIKAEIYGIASHDLYHAGQIQLLKRLRQLRG